MTAKDEIDTMLEDCDLRRPGIIEQNKPLADAIAHFILLKSGKDKRVEHIPLSWFYEKKLRPKFGGPKQLSTVRVFVREILKRDPVTGEPL